MIYCDSYSPIFYLNVHVKLSIFGKLDSDLSRLPAYGNNPVTSSFHEQDILIFQLILIKMTK